MNTQQITRTATFVVTLVMASSVATTAPAFAEHRPEGRRSTIASATSWAVPLEALGGRTMAQYVADHEAAYFPGAQS